MGKFDGIILSGGVIVAAGAAYIFNAGGLKTFIDSYIPWKVITINVNPPSAGTGVTEDDVKSAAEIVISIIQTVAVIRPDPQTLQDLLTTIQYDATDRADLILLVTNLKSLTCISTQAVCSDDESNRGAQYISDVTKKIATKYGIVLSPNAIS